MAIPFVDLSGQYKSLEVDIRARIDQVLEHGNYILGPEVKELEQRLADYVGVKHAVGCSSGTDALLLALMALGVGPGDAVFTTPFTFIATAEVISLLGATPVFVDIDPATYNIDPANVETAVEALVCGNRELHPLPRSVDCRTLRPKAVIGVDLYGLPAEYDVLRSLCRERGLALIEDAAQSFGAEYHGRKACALADIAATSFFPAKPLGCYGDGGMVFTDRDDWASVMRSLVVHGKGTDKYDNIRIGLNARLDTLQAAILLAKFGAFPGEFERRQEVAEMYHRLLREVAFVRLPKTPEGVKSGWAQYTIRVPEGDRAKIVARLASEKIPAMIYYPKPLHLQIAFRPLGYSEGDFPAAEEASREVLSLPFGPYIDTSAVPEVARHIAVGEK